MDTPIVPPLGIIARSKFEPGTCVKTKRELHEGEKFFGRMHSNQNTYRVIGHGWTESLNEKFVWEGDEREFAETWMVD